MRQGQGSESGAGGRPQAKRCHSHVRQNSQRWLWAEKCFRTFFAWLCVLAAAGIKSPWGNSEGDVPSPGVMSQVSGLTGDLCRIWHLLDAKDKCGLGHTEQGGERDGSSDFSLGYTLASLSCLNHPCPGRTPRNADPIVGLDRGLKKNLPEQPKWAARIENPGIEGWNRGTKSKERLKSSPKIHSRRDQRGSLP